MDSRNEVKREFSKEWVRQVIAFYKRKKDPDTLLANVIKVIDIMVKDNSNPGMLSKSYILEVSYTQGGEELSRESWFVKVPKSEATFALDKMEAFMYNTLFPILESFASKACENETKLQFPVPSVYYCAFSEENSSKNVLVLENLKDRGYLPVKPEICSLVFMRAAMTSLATVHAAAIAYQTALGGSICFLNKFPIIKQEIMPAAHQIREYVDDFLEPYLEYMGHVTPDISTQFAFLKKFNKFLPEIFDDILRDADMWKLKSLVHGDSKIDNFLFKKSSVDEDECFAYIIDWQGVSYGLIASDLMWTLYGFMKNLPDKNATIESFVDYSIKFYFETLTEHLTMMHVDQSKLDFPEHEYDVITLVKKGFLYEFLKTAVFKPLLTVKNREKITHWFHNQNSVPLPDERDCFKSGSSFVHYIHLWITIATEIGIFHDLATLCIQALRNSMFERADEDKKDLGKKTPEDDHVDKEQVQLEVAQIIEQYEISVVNVCETIEIKPNGDDVNDEIHSDASTELQDELT